MLKYDYRDIGKVFKKPKWGNDLMFSWYEKGGYYGYCHIGENDHLVFKAPYHETNRKAGWKVSRVGEGVLASDLVLVVDFKEKKMAKNVDYIGGKYSVVGVEFVGDRNPTTLYFKIDIDIAVAIGDLVVVEEQMGMGLVRIVSYYERNLEAKTMKIFNKAKAWVVAKVDESRQNQRREASERRLFITKQLQEKKEAMEEIAIYKVLAETDPDAAKLLEELKQLGA